MPIEQLTPPEANEAMNSDPEAILLDVRTEGEFAEGHPEGALNIPVLFAVQGGMQPNPEFVEVAEKVLSKDCRIVCSCQVGKRSQMAAQLLEQAGYGSLVNVQGGFGGLMDPASGEVIVGWRDEGLPVSAKVTDDNSYAGLKQKSEG
jgi:rhodanese-related sulfurtransferase